MAQLLIRAKNNTHSDGVITTTLIKKGDFFDVIASNKKYGRCQDKREWLAYYGNTDDWPGNWVIVDITDLSLAKGKNYLVQSIRDATVVDPEWNAPDAADRKILRYKRLWRVVWSEVPQNVINILQDVGYYETTLSKVKKFCRNKLNEAEISL